MWHQVGTKLAVAQSFFLFTLIKNGVVCNWNETVKRKDSFENIMVYIVDHWDNVQPYNPDKRQFGNINWYC